MIRYSNTVINKFDTLADGNSASGATVTVRDSSSSIKAKLYSDLAGTNEIDNPVIADDLGNYNFVVADGVYDLIISENTAQEYTISDVQIKEFNSTFTAREDIEVVDGQLVYVLQYTSAGQSYLVVDGRVMTSGASISGNTLTLTDPLREGQSAVVFHNGLISSNEVGAPGTRGNPYSFTTVAEMKDAAGTMKIGDWAETFGNIEYLDGENAQYFLVDNDEAATADDFFIVDLGDKKGVLMYTAPLASTNNTERVLSGYWGANTFPVAVERTQGGSTIKAVAFVDDGRYMLNVETNGISQDYTLNTGEDIDPRKSPAIEFDSVGNIVTFYAKDNTLYSRTINNGNIESELSSVFPANIYDIQVHRLQQSMYIFVQTEFSGVWYVNYNEGIFGAPVQFSDFGRMASKSNYESEVSKTAPDTIRFMFSDVPSASNDKVYFAVGTLTPTASGITLEVSKADGALISTVTPSSTTAIITSANADLVYTATAGNTVYVGDISKEEDYLLAYAVMPLVDGLETFNEGYTHELRLGYWDGAAWSTELVDNVVGIVGYNPSAPQLDSAGAPTGAYGIEGTAYQPLGLSFADLPTYVMQDQLEDQRQLCYVTHVGNTYDLRTKTVTASEHTPGDNQIASDNPRIRIRDNNRPVYFPRSYQGSADVSLGYFDSDSINPLSDSVNTIGNINLQADFQEYRDRNPVTDMLTAEEAADLIANNSIGQGGGSWWMHSTCRGRSEDGQDVVYVTGVYGNIDNNRDDGLAIKGTSKQFIATLTWDGATYTMTNKQLFDEFILDEHSIPGINFMVSNGTLLICSSNHADTVDSVQELVTYTFGNNTRNLSPLNLQHLRSRNTYAQVLSSRFTSWVVQRVNGSGWGFCRLTATGFPTEYEQMLTTPHNYYLQFEELDREITQGAGAVNKYHVLCAANPADDEKADIRYLKGEFEVGSGIVLRNQAGTEVFDMSGNKPAITDTDFDVAYAADPNTRRVRLLDVAYRDEGRILLADMAKSDDLINATYTVQQRVEMKDTQTSNLIMAWWNGASWQNAVIKSNIEGGLGWDPLGDVNGPTYMCNGYVYGACFHAGKDDASSLDTIYFVWKTATDDYELRSIDFNPTTGAVSNEQTLYTAPDKKILYRPKMTKGGNRRMLFFYEADRWFSYTAYSAVSKFLDLT